MGSGHVTPSGCEADILLDDAADSIVGGFCAFPAVRGDLGIGSIAAFGEGRPVGMLL